jgi:hypothetical protein
MYSSHQIPLASALPTLDFLDLRRQDFDLDLSCEGWHGMTYLIYI